MENFLSEQLKRNIANQIAIEKAMGRDVTDEQCLDIIEKGGKRAQLGEVRTWNGKEYIKTPKGWRPKPKGYKEAKDDATDNMENEKKEVKNTSEKQINTPEGVDKKEYEAIVSDETDGPSIHILTIDGTKHKINREIDRTGGQHTVYYQLDGKGSLYWDLDRMISDYRKDNSQNNTQDTDTNQNNKHKKTLSEKTGEELDRDPRFDVPDFRVEANIKLYRNTVNKLKEERKELESRGGNKKEITAIDKKIDKAQERFEVYSKIKEYREQRDKGYDAKIDAEQVDQINNGGEGDYKLTIDGKDYAVKKKYEDHDGGGKYISIFVTNGKKSYRFADARMAARWIASGDSGKTRPIGSRTMLYSGLLYEKVSRTGDLIQQDPDIE